MKKKLVCISCHRRKQKCDRKRPCLRCHNLGIECHYEAEIEKEKEKVKQEHEEKNNSLIRYRKEYTKPRLINKYNKLVELCKKIYGINENIKEDTFFKIIKQKSIHSFYQQQTFFPVINLKVINLLKDLEPGLIKTFFRFNNKIQLLISPEREAQILKSKEEHDIALKYTICACAFQTYRYLNCLPPVTLDQNPFYFKAKALLNLLIEKPSIQLAQATLLLLQQEVGFNMTGRSAITSVQAIRFCQILGLHLINDIDINETVSPEIAESFSIGCFCINHDLIHSLYYSRPPLFQYKKVEIPKLSQLSFKQRILKPYEEDLVTVLILLTKLFSYFVSVQVTLNNLIFKNQKLSNYEMKLKIDQLFKQIESFKRSTYFDFQIEEILNPEISIIEHPFLISYISLYQLHSVLLVQIKSFQLKLYNINNPKDSLHYTEYNNDVKRIALESYNNFAIIEQKCKQQLSNKHGDIYFITHFGHLFNYEYLALPFFYDNSNASTTFIKNISAKIKYLSNYWPIHSKSFSFNKKFL
ncbi:hypothetical protein K502DRAFT_368873 [Neoconidiobolus thromboides FSU 785]|nr:hypothetical protein K502DRAFT_368873 [Neoconidiobolus thromboides FSU 785]